MISAVSPAGASKSSEGSDGAGAPAQSDGGLESGSEALARLIAFKDNAEDKLEVAGFEKAVLQRRKEALEAGVCQLRSALLAREVDCANKDRDLQAFQAYVHECPDQTAKVKALEDKIKVLEEQNAAHVRARMDCPCCNMD